MSLPYISLSGVAGYVPARRRWIERWGVDDSPGRASRYIQWADDIARTYPGRKVVLYCRVSGQWQRWRDTHRRQLRSLRRTALRLGLRPIACICEVASGWKHDRTGLADAIRCASRHDAIVLAESTGRLVRSRKYKTTVPDAWPSVGEFEQLAAEANGVVLATCLHPDTHWREVRAFETQRGQGLSCAPGEIAARRERLLRTVFKLRSMDYSLSKIVSATGLPRTTVRDWLARA